MLRFTVPLPLFAYPIYLVRKLIFFCLPLIVVIVNYLLVIVIKQLNFDFVVDYISVVESSREGGFSLQPLQQFVRPQ